MNRVNKMLKNGNLLNRCSYCGSQMRNISHKNPEYTGLNFWVCKKYSNKDQLHDVQYIPDDKRPVEWNEHISRKGWITEYISVGSVPSFASELFKKNENVKRGLSQAYFLTNKNKEIKTGSDNDHVASIIMKILQRGAIPYCTFGIEKAIIQQGSLARLLRLIEGSLESKLKIENRGLINQRLIIEKLIKRQRLILDEELNVPADSLNAVFDSKLEKDFLLNWIKDNFGDTAPCWFIPQANITSIMEANNVDPIVGRVDFLFVHPYCNPIAIEIDGPEHNKEIDRERDDALKNCGVDVIRIPNDEMIKGDGVNLDQIKKILKDVFIKELPEFTEEEDLIAQGIVDTSYATKVQFALAKALKMGWISTTNCSISIKGMGRLGAVCAADFFKMINALDTIYGTKSLPKTIEVSTDEGLYQLEDNFSVKTSQKDSHKPNLRIVLEKEYGALHEVLGEAKKDVPDIIIRPAFLNITVSTSYDFFGERRKSSSDDVGILNDSLLVFLRDIFRKESFRDLQGESIVNILNQRDSVILLPTGSGKSFIYQLSGLLMPGMTIVIDPIIALMEDQVDGLSSHGIDKSLAIHSGVKKPLELLDLLGKNQFLFLFISPERLQRVDFIEKLDQVIQNGMVNQATIDEAHCVSEWGHNFRPSYLNLGKNLRQLCKNPPISALTGTASNSVLTDLLVELDIDQNDANSLIRPESLERSELEFFVIKEDLNKIEGKLQEPLVQQINNLPKRFGIPFKDFYTVNDENTYSGIVFTPHKNGEHKGVAKLRDRIKKLFKDNDLMNTDIRYYSGEAPRGENRSEWDANKRENARKFKDNEIPMLIATKSFGMGIDKPNIRYTVHFGIPGSIESFYQEAGRAGRDRKKAKCLIIYTEGTRERANALQEAKNIEELRAIFEQDTWDKSDLNHQLFFHLNNYKGIDRDQLEIDKIIDQIGHIDYAQEVIIPWRTDPVLDEDKKQKINRKTRKPEWEYARHFQEQAITKLVRLGIIESYTVQQKSFGDKHGSFTAKVNKTNPQDVKENLLKYVRLTKMDEANKIRNELDGIEQSSNKNAMKAICSVFIKFVYETIVQQRKNALFEVVQMVQGGEEKGDKYIRRRILNFLEEGIGYEEIQSLLKNEETDIDSWYELLDLAKNDKALGKLRGSSQRALSEGNNTGVLLLRGLTELLSKDADLDFAGNKIKESVESSFSEGYLLKDETAWNRITEKQIMKLSEFGDPIKTKVFVNAMIEGINDSNVPINMKSSFDQILNKSDDDNVKVVKNIFDIHDLTDNFELLTYKIEDTLNENDFKRILGI